MKPLNAADDATMAACCNFRNGAACRGEMERWRREHLGLRTKERLAWVQSAEPAPRTRRAVRNSARIGVLDRDLVRTFVQALRETVPEAVPELILQALPWSSR